jgi:branched-chain amino acid transport system ATP-binding protein
MTTAPVPATAPSPTATDALIVRDLVVRYGPIEALHGVSLRVGQGQIVCLIGANGAGKTTLLRAISGLNPAAAGTVTYATAVSRHGTSAGTAGQTVAQRIDRWPPHAIVRAGMSHVPEGRGIFPSMSVAENLDMGAYIRRDTHALAADRARALALFPRLAERLWQSAGTLSGGEQQMLAIGRALMSRPALLLLDEPSLGLAPLLVEQIFRFVKEINAQGVTVLLVEQNAHLALQISSYAYVLETGRVVIEGPAAEIAGNDQVRRAYLGAT